MYNITRITNLNTRYLKNFYFVFLVLCCYATTAFGQATTSSINGQVTDEKQDLLPGAAIIATHLPSGTQYGTAANAQGKFQLQGMRPGGPYQIEFSFVGYHKLIYTDIYLKLGETSAYDASLKPSTEIDEVVVTASASKFAGEKTGASNHISTGDIRRFPNINRNLTELVKMSPYSNGAGIGGRDVRLSNFMVDGANFNNATGLDGAALPGGGNPISIDAIEEIQISVAPFDVRLSNFIGGAVSAVTKSGTNLYRGSAYTYLKNENLRGNKVDRYDLGERPQERRTVYGFTLGGPIVRNKLFFFVNGEREYSPFPIHKWKLSQDGKFDSQNMISRVTDADMSRFSKDLKEMYGYDTGSWTDFSGKAEVYRAVARIDWNISDRHRFMLRYNYTGQQRDNAPAAGALNIGTTPIGPYSMSFRNSTWQLIDNIHSFTMELHSRLGSRINNQLLASFNLNDVNNRKCNGDFPTIDIMAPDETGTSRAFMNAGYDQYAWRNGVNEKIWSITDNLSIQLGSHNLMLGASFESQYISNCYMRYGAGYYRYASYDDFVNRRAPIAFALSYSLTGDEQALADVHYGQFSVYAQDEFNAGERLKLFYGVRMDLPFYLNDRYENPSITSYEFNGQKLSTASWPQTKMLLSPRIGFNYALTTDKSLKLRGGTGIFTGRFPLIFLSKMQEGSGMLTASVQVNQANDPVLGALAGGILTPREVLDKIAPQFPDRFPTEPGAVNNIVTIDRNFKMPQVWKTSLAVDWSLPLPFPSMLTLEGIYIKDINAIQQRNLNVIGENDPQMARLSGPDNRYYYPGNTGMRIHKNINYAMLMTNTNKGYSYNLNATLDMEPLRGLSVMAAYTYTASKTLTNNRSNQIDGAWSQEPSVNGPNYLSLHNASYMFSPHRIIASAGYTFNYAKNLSTSFSLFYTGERAGSFSYVIDGDLNNDGYQPYDLMYIPATKEELNFSKDVKVGNKTFTAAEQRDAFWAFVNQDPYLSKHKGQYAATNGAFLPWYHRVDLRVTQDFKVKTKKSTHTLQLSVDIMNIGNLLNNSWGLAKSAVTMTPLKFQGLNDQNEPTYTMNTINENGEAILPYRSFAPVRNTTNCWQLQLGIRYIFN